MHGPAIALAPQLDADSQPAVLDERERVRRIYRDRCEDGQILGEELPLEPFALGVCEFLGLDNEDARCRHLVLERAPAGLLIADETGRKAIDLCQLLDRRQAVLARLHDAGSHLAIEARGADHVEFVEVGGGDRQEAQALEQGMAAVLRFLQHPAIELQPGQLTVVVARRPGNGGGGRNLVSLDFCFSLAVVVLMRP